MKKKIEFLSAVGDISQNFFQLCILRNRHFISRNSQTNLLLETLQRPVCEDGSLAMVFKCWRPPPTHHPFVESHRTVTKNCVGFYMKIIQNYTFFLFNFYILNGLIYKLSMMCCLDNFSHTGDDNEENIIINLIMYYDKKVR